jgi:alanyl-tRNA synthetase
MLRPRSLIRGRRSESHRGKSRGSRTKIHIPGNAAQSKAERHFLCPVEILTVASSANPPYIAVLFSKTMSNLHRHLYYQSDALVAPALVQRCFIHEGKPVAILDTALFHPQGGGQPADTGWLNATPVLDAQLVNGEIWLWLAETIDIKTVRQSIDAGRRQLHSLLHSAGHLLGNAGQALGLQPIKAEHWPNKCKVAFRETAERDIDIDAIQTAVDTILANPLERVIVINNHLRTVGFGSLPSFPCGGTHVASTTEIAKINISKLKRKNGECSISYTAERSINERASCIQAPPNC